ncbi:uncharacterized protein LOC106639262 [Copidosoma floridanum]|uniref:uncharacterized protein LOC106639262 n=1 Tax=Copidosoma floridanum TaxID=29053 RepID=UPI0006C9D99F|nr:uncharacterized protein LOC106639262 [Copidosoma floridanum]
MHRKSRPRRPPLLLLLLLHVLLENPYVAGTSAEYSRACDQVTCRIGEQCVSRKFWCTRPPCPNMTYCSKSRKELLKGPETCESVVCAPGYKCLVRVRDCEWNKKCKQRTARCVTEREYEEGPASCADVVCPSSYRCVLREIHCYRPPCKLTKSCARDRDVARWFDRCRKLGCQSEHNCFLRRPPPRCTVPPCDHVPDCLEITDFSEDDRCRGWICPTSQDCVIDHANSGACNYDLANGQEAECRIVRSCRESILLPATLLDSAALARDAVQASATKATKTRSSGASPAGESAWLTYLRWKAGAEAVRYWIDRAKTSQDYEGFLDWLEQMANLLGPDTYRLWLSEVELASIDAPEFQSWLNTARANNRLPVTRGRPTPDDRTRLPGRFFFPVRRVYYEDDDGIDPMASGTGFDFSYHQPPPPPPRSSPSPASSSTSAKPQTIPPGRAPYEPRLEDTSGQHSPDSSGFNEAGRFTGTPGIQNGSLSYPTGQPRKSLPASSEIAQGIPSFQDQEFVNGPKNSWKAWQSYYQLNPVDTPPPSLNNPGSSGVRASAQRDTYYLSNYTRVRQNYSLEPQMAQPKVFFPNDKLPRGTTTTPASDKSTPNVASILDSVAGFEQYRQIKPNILKLSAENASPDGQQQPKFLIYFPPPYNFLIYHSDERTPPANASRDGVTEPPGEDKRDRQSRREYIRKLLKELLKYWDEEEKSYEDGGPGNGTTEAPRVSNRTNSQSSRSSALDERLDVDDDDTSLDQFLDWLTKNTSLLDLKPRRKGPPSFTDEDEDKTDNVMSSQQESPSHGVPSPRKVRILVDIDKNPELMRALFSRNLSEGPPDSPGEYQVIVNLEDYVDPQEEEVISRKLVDIVKYQLRRNMTRNGTLPESLWVLPVYDDGANGTSAQGRVDGDDRLLTLKDVDFPTDARSNGDLRSEQRGLDDVEGDYGGDDEDGKSYAESKIQRVTSRYKLHRYAG